ncbi:MAG: hypothetical protein RSD47_02835 [Romboutsia sp.]
MLHRLSSILFLLAITTYFFKHLRFIDKNISLKLHILTGTLGAILMVIYAISDYVKEAQVTIIPIGIISTLIIISGTKNIRKKYKWMHLLAVILFIIALIYHLINK